MWFAGQSPYTPVKDMWLWKCKDVGMFFIWEKVLGIFEVLLLMLGKSWLLRFILKSPGARWTQHIVYLLKILQGSGTYIWGYRIHNCHWYVVHWMCLGWASSWTGWCVLFIFIWICLNVGVKFQPPLIIF